MDEGNRTDMEGEEHLPPTIEEETEVDSPNAASKGEAEQQLNPPLVSINSKGKL